MAFGGLVLVGLMFHYGYYPSLLGLAILPVLLVSAVMCRWAWACSWRR